MDDPFDRGCWPLPRLAVELDDLAARSDPPDGSVDMAAVDWAIDQLADGTPPRDLCEAALWVGVRRGRAEGRGPQGLVTHAALAAAACADAGARTSDPSTAAMAAVQHVAYTLGAYRGGVNDHREGPNLLGWYEPHECSGHPVEEFLAAASAGECDLADHCWLAAATSDPSGAEEALIAAGAAGYHLNEHKLVYPAQLRAWLGAEAPVDPVLFRVAARYAANHLQDAARADARRADAAALAMEAEEHEFPLTAPTDVERVSVVATGIARTAPKDLAPLLLASLSDGLAPADLVDAVSLVTAARFSFTPFPGGGPVGAVHAGTGANAVRRCLDRTSSRELRYELALCAVDSPNALRLSDVAELAVPPSDDGALEDLLAALEEGDPDAAADAASAVPPEDPDAVAAAWSAVMAAAVTDQWMLLHGIKHAVAMQEDFRDSVHPARIWYLAAAARTAAHAAALDQPVAEKVRRRLLI